MSPSFRGVDMDINETLKQIGLTESEVKVYLALLKLDTSSKGAIVKESKIAHSKIYDVLDKLIDKGLASTITKNNVKHYSAAPINRLKDYLTIKQNELKKHEKIIDDILPKLATIEKITTETKAELFIGWKGIDTVYSTLLSQAKKGDTAYVLGANQGKNPEKTKKFFYVYSNRAKQKGINIKIIFDENSRKYVNNLEKTIKSSFKKRFLFKQTAAEFLITKGITAIIILKEEPIILLVRDEETAKSFETYFHELWKIAKE